jgi:3-phenylpropionate/trans-cinnamate dioxygenase ferredoxin subunit
VPEVEVCPLAELPPGTGRLHQLCEGEWDARVCEVICPRHGARFDLRTGRALTLPAYIPVDTYPVRVRDDGVIVVEMPS